MRISVTEVQEYLQCARRWDYASDNRQALDPKEPQPALFFGTGIHKGLESFYSGKNPVEAFEAWFWEELKAIRAKCDVDVEMEGQLMGMLPLGKGMLAHYVSHYATEPLKVLRAEMKFEVPIPGCETEPGFLVGTIDGKAQYGSSRIWALEHKSFADAMPAGYLDLDIQMTAYPWALRALFPSEDIAGTLYNGLRKKLPSVPPLLKDGKAISRAAIDSTHGIYLAEILRHGFNPADYRDILANLEAKGNSFFVRTPVPRSPHEMEHFGKFIAQVHDRMVREPLKTFMYNPTMDCGWWCGYRDLCQMRTFGGDEEGLKVMRFVRKTKSRYPSGDPYTRPE
jgi:hypothetical protein